MVNLTELERQIRDGEIDPVRLLNQFERLPPEQQELLNTPRSSKWAGVRAKHLQKHNHCEICLGKEYLQVHHILPFHLRPELELDPDNLITLCEKPSRNCHFTWGHGYNWSSYNPKVWECVEYWRKIVGSMVQGEPEPRDLPTLPLQPL